MLLTVPSSWITVSNGRLLGVKNESTIDVTFTPASDTSTAAHIAVLVNTDAGVAAPHTLKTLFTDNVNRVTLAARAEYSVGRAGGTLSITDKRAGRSVLRGPGNELVLLDEYDYHPRWGEGPWLLSPKGPGTGSAAALTATTSLE